MRGGEHDRGAAVSGSRGAGVSRPLRPNLSYDGPGALSLRRWTDRGRLRPLVRCGPARRADDEAGVVGLANAWLGAEVPPRARRTHLRALRWVREGPQIFNDSSACVQVVRGRHGRQAGHVHAGPVCGGGYRHPVRGCVAVPHRLRRFGHLHPLARRQPLSPGVRVELEETTDARRGGALRARRAPPRRHRPRPPCRAEVFERMQARTGGRAGRGARGQVQGTRRPQHPRVRRRRAQEPVGGGQGTLPVTTEPHSWSVRATWGLDVVGPGPWRLCAVCGAAYGACVPDSHVDSFSRCTESVSRPRDITFEQVEGDFVCFKGVWRMQQGTSPDTTCLSYSVLVTPQVTRPRGSGGAGPGKQWMRPRVVRALT